MHIIIPVLMLMLLCGCSKEKHVQKKVDSILPQIEQDMREGVIVRSFPPDDLNAWVHALEASQVVDQLQIAIEKVPECRRASLWMLKAYASPEIWQSVSNQYPDIVASLPSVAGYGNLRLRQRICTKTNQTLGG